MIGPGQHAGRFEILSHLGSGGMGEVYRARDSRLNRDVALKILPAHLTSDRERLVRFAQEARSASGLNHPNIVTIYEIGQHENLPYIAMELIDGVTLRGLVKGGPLSLKRTLSVASQLADGLAKAHTAGLVHRDLKPENIMVTRDGYVKILDFGIAKLSRPSESDPETAGLTKSGFVLGTPGYMSPEQAKGEPLDPRSDQFSFGLLLYEMVTGRKAFERASPIQTMSAIIQEEAEPLESLAPRTPLPLRWIIERCIEKDPDNRFASTQDLARDLQNLRHHAGQLMTTPTSASAAIPRSPTGAQDGLGMEGSGTRRLDSATSARKGPSPERQTESRPRRMEVRNILLGVGLAFLGLGIGYWTRGLQKETAPPRFSGELLLSGSTRVFSPQVSPDGSVLAFITPVKGVLQAAVMKPVSGDWAVLTKETGRGNVNRISWTRDGSRILYDRVSDHPAGIFSIGVLGGEERLILDAGQAPDSLPDGSLVMVGIDKGGQFRFERFRPENPKPVPFGPEILREFSGLAYRPLPDGRRILFYGALSDATNAGGTPRRAYLLDVATGKAEPFAPGLPLVPPLSVSADGLRILGSLRSGDLVQVVSISLAGDEVQPVLSLPGRVAYVCERTGGDLFIGMLDRTGTLLRFPVEGGTPEVLASDAQNVLMHPLQFPDGRFLVPSVAAGRRRLLVGTAGETLRPFLDVPDQSGPPAVFVPPDSVAFLAAPAGGGAPVLALASARDGRVLKRYDETAGIAPQALAVSPGGRTFFFADKGSVFELSASGGKPKRICAGDGVAVDASTPGGGLVVQRNGTGGVALVRRAADGLETPIPISGELLPSALPISGPAVGPDGRIVLTATPRGGWTSVAAIFSPGGFLTPIPIQFHGDVLAPSWGPDGKILAMGPGSRSELWLFRRIAPGGKPEPR